MRTKELVQKRLPNAFVCASHEVFPEIREFERTSTTVANAYLGPTVDEYLAQMTTRLRERGHSGAVLVTHSGGGVMTLESARTLPARMCQSGPAAG
jgi:N-methylhydantoinase A